MRGPTGLPVSRVLVDTSAYYALADPTDTRQAVASTIIRRLAAASVRLFTTNLILAETHALVLVRRGRAPARQALREIEGSSTTILRVSVEDERRARAILDRYDDKDFSLTDATSFAVMERLKIPHAFTFDRNFAQYGLTVLTPEMFR
jgi:uncharacterized protein